MATAVHGMHPNVIHSCVKVSHNVTEIDPTVLSLIYPAMNSSSSSVKTGINNCQPLVYIHTFPFIPNMISLNGFKYRYLIE